MEQLDQGPIDQQIDQGSFPSDMLQLHYIKQLSPSDAASSKQIKLPKNEAKGFIGELRHKQRCMVVFLDHHMVCWEFLCTCYGCQYALSRVAAFANAYNLKAGQYLIFYQDTLNRLRLMVTNQVPIELQQLQVHNTLTRQVALQQEQLYMLPPGPGIDPAAAQTAVAAAAGTATAAAAAGAASQPFEHLTGSEGYGVMPHAAAGMAARLPAAAVAATGNTAAAAHQQQQRLQTFPGMDERLGTYGFTLLEPHRNSAVFGSIDAESNMADSLDSPQSDDMGEHSDTSSSSSDGWQQQQHQRQQKQRQQKHKSPWKRQHKHRQGPRTQPQQQSNAAAVAAAAAAAAAAANAAAAAAAVAAAAGGASSNHDLVGSYPPPAYHDGIPVAQLYHHHHQQQQQRLQHLLHGQPDPDALAAAASGPNSSSRSHWSKLLQTSSWQSLIAAHQASPSTAAGAGAAVGAGNSLGNDAGSLSADTAALVPNEHHMHMEACWHEQQQQLQSLLGKRSLAQDWPQRKRSKNVQEEQTSAAADAAAAAAAASAGNDPMVTNTTYLDTPARSSTSIAALAHAALAAADPAMQFGSPACSTSAAPPAAAAAAGMTEGSDGLGLQHSLPQHTPVALLRSRGSVLPYGELSGLALTSGSNVSSPAVFAPAASDQDQLPTPATSSSFSIQKQRSSSFDHVDFAAAAGAARRPAVSVLVDRQAMSEQLQEATAAAAAAAAANAVGSNHPGSKTVLTLDDILMHRYLTQQRRQQQQQQQWPRRQPMQDLRSSSLMQPSLGFLGGNSSSNTSSRHQYPGMGLEERVRAAVQQQAAARLANGSSSGGQLLPLFKPPPPRHPPPAALNTGAGNTSNKGNGNIINGNRCANRPLQIAPVTTQGRLPGSAALAAAAPPADGPAYGTAGVAYGSVLQQRAQQQQEQERRLLQQQWSACLAAVADSMTADLVGASKSLSAAADAAAGAAVIAGAGPGTCQHPHSSTSGLAPTAAGSCRALSGKGAAAAPDQDENQAVVHRQQQLQELPKASSTERASVSPPSAAALSDVTTRTNNTGSLPSSAERASNASSEKLHPFRAPRSSFLENTASHPGGSPAAQQQQQQQKPQQQQRQQEDENLGGVFRASKGNSVQEGAGGSTGVGTINIGGSSGSTRLSPGVFRVGGWTAAAPAAATTAAAAASRQNAADATTDVEAAAVAPAAAAAASAGLGDGTMFDEWSAVSSLLLLRNGRH